MFTIANQSLQQGRDNFKALKQEMATLPQGILLELLLNENLPPETQLEAFERLQSQWIKPVLQRPKDSYGTLVEELESDLVVKLEKERCLEEIKEIFSKMPWLEEIGIRQQDILQEVEKIANRMKGSLPAYVALKDKEDDNTVEVEHETERETETELQVDDLPKTSTIELGIVKATKILIEKELKYRNGNQLLAFPLKSYFENDSTLSSYANAFENVYATLNVLEWTGKKPTVGDFKLLGSHRTPLQHLLIHNSKVIGMSHYEAGNYVKCPKYYNLTLGYTDPSKKPSLEELSSIVKLKFLNGEAHYNKDQVALLKTWFKSNDPEKMRKLYREHILTGYPQKASRYLDSPLQHLFAEMCTA